MLGGHSRTKEAGGNARIRHKAHAARSCSVVGSMAATLLPPTKMKNWFSGIFAVFLIPKHPKA